MRCGGVCELWVGPRAVGLKVRQIPAAAEGGTRVTSGSPREPRQPAWVVHIDKAMARGHQGCRVQIRGGRRSELGWRTRASPATPRSPVPGPCLGNAGRVCDAQNVHRLGTPHPVVKTRHDALQQPEQVLPAGLQTRITVASPSSQLQRTPVDSSPRAGVQPGLDQDACRSSAGRYVAARRPAAGCNICTRGGGAPAGPPNPHLSLPRLPPTANPSKGRLVR